MTSNMLRYKHSHFCGEIIGDFNFLLFQTFSYDQKKQCRLREGGNEYWMEEICILGVERFTWLLFADAK